MQAFGLWLGVKGEEGAGAVADQAMVALITFTLGMPSPQMEGSCSEGTASLPILHVRHPVWWPRCLGHARSTSRWRGRECCMGGVAATAAHTIALGIAVPLTTPPPPPSVKHHASRVCGSTGPQA